MLLVKNVTITGNSLLRYVTSKVCQQICVKAQLGLKLDNVLKEMIKNYELQNIFCLKFEFEFEFKCENFLTILSKIRYF